MLTPTSGDRCRYVRPGEFGPPSCGKERRLILDRSRWKGEWIVTRFWAGLAVAGTVLVSGVVAQAPEQSKEAPPQSAHEQALDAPGAEHAFLAGRAGEYDTHITFRPGPDAEPQHSAGKATITSILDGRFICEDSTGTLAGQPFSGRRITGFNTRSQKFESTWCYSHSTAMLILAGESNDLGKTIHLSGAFANAEDRMAPLDVVIRQIDQHRFVIEMHATGTDGRRYVVLETRYTRK